jgi:hypothetical protein
MVRYGEQSRERERGVAEPILAGERQVQVEHGRQLVGLAPQD